MTELLDYSQGPLSGGTIRAAGYAGSIRYITSPELAVYLGGPARPGNPNPKHVTPAEYASHKQAGLLSYFVYQGGVDDADGGYSLGVQNAQRALSGLRWIGAPVNTPVFFTNDRTTLPNPVAWQQYLLGAASVLGASNVGAYGFANAMDAARGRCAWFWQSGRESEVRPWVNFYQWNNGSVRVGGQTCDINRVRIPIASTVEDPNVKNLVLGRDPVTGAIWVGDGLTRRHLPDSAQVGDLQFWIEKKGGDKTVYDIANLDVLGSPVPQSIADLKDRPAAPAATVDVPALAAELKTAGVGGASVAEVREVVNNVRLTAGE